MQAERRDNEIITEDEWTDKKETPYEYTDANGNTKPVQNITTEEHLLDVRDQLGAVKKRGSIDPSTGEKWTRKAKKKEKQRLRTVMDNIRKSNVDFAAFEQTMTTQLAQDEINQEASGMYNMQGSLFAQAMLAKGEPVEQTDPKLAMYNGARAIQGYDDEGHMIFTYVNKYGEPFKNKDGNNMAIGKGDLNTLFVPKSPKRAVFNTLVDHDAIVKNLKYGTGRFHNQIKKVVNEQITDKNTFLDIAFSQGDGTTGTLANSLNAIEYDSEGVLEVKETPMFNMLIDAVKSVGNKDEFDISGPDGIPDGEFTEEDYNTQENLDLVIKEALSGKNLQLGKALVEAYYKFELDTVYENVMAANPDPITKKGGGTKTGRGGKSGKIDLGVSRLTNQRVYATEKDIETKHNQIVNAKSGDSVEGWDGKRTYRYTYHVPKSGKGTWRYQLWDADREQFVTKGGFEGAAGGGGGVKSYSTNDVIGDLIPQTMLTSNIKSR